MKTHGQGLTLLYLKSLVCQMGLHVHASEGCSSARLEWAVWVLTALMCIKCRQLCSNCHSHFSVHSVTYTSNKRLCKHTFTSLPWSRTESRESAHLFMVSWLADKSSRTMLRSMTKASSRISAPASLICTKSKPRSHCAEQCNSAVGCEVTVQAKTEFGHVVQLD